MPFVTRTADGHLESLHRHATEAATEFLADDHPLVRGFVHQAELSFDRLDADFVRVIEDVIDALLQKNVLAITDLPVEAQNKLLARRSFRDQASAHSLRLFDGGAAAGQEPDSIPLG